LSDKFGLQCLDDWRKLEFCVPIRIDFFAGIIGWGVRYLYCRFEWGNWDYHVNKGAYLMY
jgi:hypothetical protein